MEVKCAHTEIVDIETLIPNKRNPNKHPDAQIKMLAKIMKKQGWRNPVVVSNLSGQIVKGHGRLSAAKLNGWTKVPIDRQNYANQEEELADLVADNKIAELAESDELMIQDIALDLGPDFDFDLLGIPDFEIKGVDTLPPGSEDEIPDRVDPRTKLGDIYDLGNHRLMCGDSTSIDAVEKLMNGEKAGITFTSPPYNAGRFGYDGGKDKYKGTSDDRTQDDYFDFLVSFTDICLGASQYVFFNNQFLSGNRHALAKFIGHYSSVLKEVFPWIKNTAPPNVNKGVFTNRFEFFLCLEMGNTKKGYPVEWQGKYHNIIEGHTAAKENVTEGTHSATMPIYVPEWFFERLPFAQSVFDPFGGSGSTLIACEKTNRKCFMMELDPYYCDVIVTRWEKYTGKTARLLTQNHDNNATGLESNG